MHNKECWLVLKIWDVPLGTFTQLENAGFEINLSDSIFEDNFNDSIIKENYTQNDKILLINYKKYDFEKIRPVIQCIAAYELGIEPSANINAYLISFDNIYVLINLYDDRGMEVLTHDSVLNKLISDKFNLFLNK
ncbi:hypothetical protein VB264_23685 [Arcicella aquatica]|uniref:DUF3885 domain-containing protein n=1 Tax=Arcicella aquatica TaxID=217141 RepID=A0ABU5QUP2_9BACT|nr:hypothetical protein [Arcicella aquatica]MEA5260822.1 hypothetical protein [Arcicella aquatica]